MATSADRPTAHGTSRPAAHGDHSPTTHGELDAFPTTGAGA
ncbi:hypothetical protein ACWCXX_23120 [Streptomyces sp. NPDC001732]